ncbi:hypothetical protein FOV72_08180 [Gordonia rubripertincta]|uniref:hypothetical protein n=1 Tax=Gordonia rubripertincta TaxID=36822 RepID=UPI00117C35EB|nr:hypothetical protein [Gordonia rubripertincta]QMU20231.1 hypothetical protein H3V45_19690 [Gordonia rubripertincta]TSD96724.1 hypothetical protein FOV72_08180 [Gordonia rubripertincta]
MTDTTRKPPGKAVEVTGGILDRAQRLQGPAVKKYVDSLRRKYPDDSPAQIIERLEKRYLNAVTGSGSAVGAAAAVPGVGTMTAFGAMTGDTAFFLEASALLALSIAEVHGIGVHETDRRKSLVLAVALGEEGVLALGRVVGTRGGPLRRLGGAALPSGAITKLNKTLVNKLVRKYAIRRAPLIFGKLMPAGIGAVIGGAGSRALGRKVVHNAREAFGPAPSFWVLDAEVVDETSPLPPGSR